MGDEEVVQGFSAKNVRAFGRVDVAIIGSGIAGLSCAIMLARGGWRVIVLEQHDRVGGTMHAFTLGDGKRSWEFDAGVHYVGASLVRSSLFRRLVRNRVSWCRMSDDFDCATLGTTTANQPSPRKKPAWTWRMSSSRKTVIARLRERFPRHGANVEAYLRACARCSFWSGVVAVALKVLPMDVARAVEPWVAAFFAFVARIPHRRATVSQVLAACGLDPESEDSEIREVAGVLAYSWPDVGVPPSQMPFVVGARKATSLADGAYFPKGSGAAIALALAEAAVATRRCAIFVRAPVDRIETRSGAVVGVVSRGVVVETPKVVSAAGIYNTLVRMLPDVTTKCGAHAEYAAVADRVRDGSLPLSSTWVSLFVGLDDDDDRRRAALPKHNLFCFPTWDHDRNVASSKRAGLNGEFAACFITSSSAKEDRADKPSSLVVLALVEWDWFVEFTTRDDDGKSTIRRDSKTAFDALKTNLTTRLLNLLYDKIPDLEGRVVYTSLATPLCVNKFLGTNRGEFNGLAHTVDRFDLPTQRLLRPKLAFLDGLYLTGHDVTQQGLPAALNSAVLTCFTLSPLSWLRVAPFVLWDFCRAAYASFYL